MPFPACILFDVAAGAAGGAAPDADPDDEDAAGDADDEDEGAPGGGAAGFPQQHEGEEAPGAGDHGAGAPPGAPGGDDDDAAAADDGGGGGAPDDGGDDDGVPAVVLQGIDSFARGVQHMAKYVSSWAAADGGKVKHRFERTRKVDRPTTEPEYVTAMLNHLYMLLLQIRSIFTGVTQGAIGAFLSAIQSWAGTKPEVRPHLDDNYRQMLTALEQADLLAERDVVEYDACACCHTLYRGEHKHAQLCPNPECAKDRAAVGVIPFFYRCGLVCARVRACSACAGWVGRGCGAVGAWRGLPWGGLRCVHACTMCLSRPA